ncbi:unnamed protein product [Didymodactylos carnosus]|uniref:IRG-type G domain-containing protein n=1 Tax=Didymodactylos carnosus TaxID=1234261 RepID=A0A815V8D0_9BILA|nr:unnamed protein product [Didymodactylos carnosus]CAF4384887.1 unnamed protein product [Didymodactylos carnosus]
MSYSRQVRPPVTTSHLPPAAPTARARPVGGFDNAETGRIHPNEFDVVNMSEADKRAAAEYFNTNGVRGFENFLNNRLNAWHASPLKVAKTGESGSGKSMFINTIRGLNPADNVAALTGVTETTDRVEDYPHPENPNLIFYDLPGVNTPNFPRDTYLEKVNYKQYDFFIIISRTRFTDNDLWLAKEVKTRGKSFFFVRTYVDVDLVNERRDRPETYDDRAVLDRIRNNSLDHLRTIESNPKVFVICGLLSQTTKFDYGLMAETLLMEYPSYKRQAMILAMTMNCKEVMKAKVNELRSKIWMVATLSAGIAAVPVPGLSFSVDQTLLLAWIIRYKKQLGLDDKSLQKVAALHDIPLAELQGQIQSIFSVYFFTDLPKLMYVLLESQAVGGAVEEFSRFIPIVGSFIASAISFSVIMGMLHKMLNDMEKAVLLLIDVIKERSVSPAAEPLSNMKARAARHLSKSFRGFCE